VYSFARRGSRVRVGAYCVMDISVEVEDDSAIRVKRLLVGWLVGSSDGGSTEVSSAVSCFLNLRF